MWFEEPLQFLRSEGHAMGWHPYFPLISGELLYRHWEERIERRWCPIERSQAEPPAWLADAVHFAQSGFHIWEEVERECTGNKIEGLIVEFEVLGIHSA